MERFVMKNLVTWKSREGRKPLLMLGARQVGKTWLLQEIGRTHYSGTAYVNLDNPDDIVLQQFEGGINLERTLQAVHASTGVLVIAGKTRLILDEIQQCPRAITALKYFAEQMPKLDIAAAGSLLGPRRFTAERDFRLEKWKLCICIHFPSANIFAQKATKF